MLEAWSTWRGVICQKTSSNVKKRCQAFHWGTHTFQYLGHIFLELFDFSRKEASSPLLGVERHGRSRYGTGQGTSIEVPALVLSLFSVIHTLFPHHSSSVSPENRPPPAIGVGRGQGPVGAQITRIKRRPWRSNCSSSHGSETIPWMLAPHSVILQ